MAFNKRSKIKLLLESNKIGEKITIMGWVRTKRGNKNVSFIAVNDGSTISNYQVVADPNIINEDILKRISTGACIKVSGEVVASQGSGQDSEVIAENIEVLGEADPEKYPLQPKKHSMEFLRDIAHLRMRTNTFGAVFRVRHALAFAVHHYFNKKGFFYIHTPIITASDAEGAGETFKVTTLDLKKTPLTDNGAIDYSKDFFERETNLTVSGQLEGELAAMALAEIYTFGPTFRAENSNTTRHLAEFWMIEPEMAFYDAEDNQDLAEDFLKSIITYAMEHCKADLEFLDKRAAEENAKKPVNERTDLGLLDRLRFVAEHAFERVTYTEAIDILRNSKPNKKKKFNYLIEEWGTDLQSEHERFLVEKHFKKPVILTDYPKDIKAFYMKQNDDGKTVAAMDILFPGIGEIVGGSQREENMEKLTGRMDEMGISQEELYWYLDTRRFGATPHSGFGLGFERMVQFVTGMGNIRDVIAFPRTPGNAEF
ncbi:asparagine--tRNA ligase [Echinicola strongylocentroti]|uniref:Asparagine--tRNA ligase n=1 Tax=Echinicola strongylocentroti TaxID=1795355 RepID=A0A2Z4IGM7_9BACT|nr:asparagine--tRNA ligase [Echinicola strongylocentroti]AWW29869.1 asparagine--tRNA ligase [Echinicola strongylocentroti]